MRDPRLARIASQAPDSIPKAPELHQSGRATAGLFGSCGCLEMKNRIGIVKSRIVIDTAVDAPPAVVGVTACVPDGQYQTGTVIPILIHFSRPVTVPGTPQLALATGGSSPTLDCRLDVAEHFERLGAARRSLPEGHDRFTPGRSGPIAKTQTAAVLNVSQPDVG